MKWKARNAGLPVWKAALRFQAKTILECFAREKRLQARIAELEEEHGRAFGFFEDQFDILTAEQLWDLARAKGQDPEAEAERVREIFRDAYERIVNPKIP
jgi:hypothetical protein